LTVLFKKAAMKSWNVGRMNHLHPLSAPRARHLSRASMAMVALAGFAHLACAAASANTPGGTAPLPAGFRSETTRTNGIDLHYVIGGQGEPLVLLHGWPQTWYEYHRVMPRLAEQYTVIVPDLRGAGGSDAPATGYDKETMAEDLRGLLDHLKLDAVNLVGHDIGVMVAYPLAAKYPARVKRLVLAEAPIPGVEPGWTAASSLRFLWHFGFHNERGLPELLTAGRERDYLLSFYKKFSAVPNAFPDEEVDVYARAYARPGRMTAGFEWYRAFDTDAARNAELQKTKLPMPLLMMAGGAFGNTEEALVAQGQVIATQVRGSVIAGSGHWILEEQPDLFVTALLAFLAAPTN
jgi:pimeloyl-ACP methyl ester carboxylesterase